MSAERRIEGEGTSEERWRAWDLERRLPAVSLEELVELDRRLVVVAPHPDDEVLGAGGLLLTAARAGRSALLVAVTDGDASHPGSRIYPRERLRTLRREESRAALAALGVELEEIRLGIPDGKVSEHQAELSDRLASTFREGDVVFATWELDGHPDHEAVGGAARQVAMNTRARYFAMPVWTWHWAEPGDPRVPWDRALLLPLASDVAEAKARSVASHRTQLEPDPSTGRPAVLPPWATARLLRRFEVFFR